jgi:hypothetical protein
MYGTQCRTPVSRRLTEQEIAMALTSTGEPPSQDYHDNLWRALVGLADRGLIGLEPGHWMGPIARRTWVPTLCQATEAGDRMAGVLRALALIGKSHSGQFSAD